jgi:hypothetical protein
MSFVVVVLVAASINGKALSLAFVDGELEIVFSGSMPFYVWRV